MEGQGTSRLPTIIILIITVPLRLVMKDLHLTDSIWSVIFTMSWAR